MEYLLLWFSFLFAFAEDPNIVRMPYTNSSTGDIGAISDSIVVDTIGHILPSNVQRIEHRHTMGTIFQYRFYHGEVPLWGKRISVLIDNTQRVLLRTGTIPKSFWNSAPDFDLSFEEAVEQGIHLSLAVPQSSVECTPFSGSKIERYLQCTGSDIIWRISPRIFKVYWDDENTLVSAYRMELIGENKSKMFALEVVVDAQDGALLSQRSLRVGAEDYLVWADEDGFFPTPFGAMSGNDFTGQSLNVGDWAILEGRTKSNHVEAYTDEREPDGYSNGDTYAFAPFNNIFDPDTNPDADDGQRSVGITQLFFIINQLHQTFLDVGFDEASGAALQENEGSIGEDGDPIKAEAQDFSGFNNANMMTPADGGSPVMQMYLWYNGEASMRVLSPDGLLGSYDVGTSSFGLIEGMEGTVVLVDDGNGNTRDGCTPFSVGPNIALIERGDCSFIDKAKNAFNGGAIGVLIYNDSSSSPNEIMSMGGEEPIDIPVFALSRNMGTMLKQEEEEVHVSIDLDLFRDSSMDGQIVAHEWAHYMFSRLSLGGYTTQYHALNEGTADFVALLTGTRFDDVDLSGAYPVGGFSDSDMARGIRRAPYSIDSDQYPMTFRHIRDGIPLPFSIGGGGQPNSESHQAGEIWCNALWNALVLLVEEHGAEEGSRRMHEYLVMALKVFPPDPSFLDARDAFLGVSAVDVIDYLHFWTAFAKMGMGITADAGEKEDEGNESISENFSSDGYWIGRSLTISDEIKSCDDDGILDVGERGVITISGQNLGGANLDEYQTIEIFDQNGNPYSGFVFPEGNQFSLSLGVLEEASFSLPIQIEEVGNSGPFLLRVGTQEIRIDVHLDIEDEVQFIDGFVHEDQVWEWFCTPDCSAWRRDTEEPFDPVMWGEDLGIGSDSALVSPEILVSENEDLILSWSHRYSFEKTEGTAYDGGVVEVSINDGEWEDLDTYVNMPYTDRIVILSELPHVQPESNAPIADRLAFSGDSPGYPEYREVSLNIGRFFAGDRIRVRFRIGTDVAIGATGWFIDTVLFSGAEEPPFTGFVQNEQDCVYPIADAGVDQEAEGMWKVLLNGSGSFDPDGASLEYSWEQVSGRDVVLYQEHTSQPFFFPFGAGKHEFLLRVKNEQGLESEDRVIIHIPIEDGTEVSIEGGCQHAPIERILISLLPFCLYFRTRKYT